MKKKTFGRIAALGLAGLTAVPAISIVASADVKYSSQKDEDGIEIITGSAWKVHWSIQKITHKYSVTASGTLLDEPTYLTSKDSDYAAATDTVGGYSLEDTTYYMYKSNGADIPTFVNNAVKAANDTYTGLKAQWENYAWWYAHQAGGNLINTEGNRTINNVTYYWHKDADTGVFGWYTKSDAGEFVSAAYPQTTSPTQPVEYTFLENPVNTEISLSNLAAVFNTSYVSISGNIITASTKDDAKSAGGYVIGQGSSTSTSTGTDYTEGNYYVPSGYRYATSKVYRSGITGVYYPNYAALVAREGVISNYTELTPVQGYTSVYCWFNPVDGNYYTQTQAITSYPYAVYVTASTSTATSETAVYSVNGLYYHTWSSAYAAAGYDTTKITWIRDYTAAGNYFSRITGLFYSTYESALYASNSNSSYVVTINGTGSYYDDPYYYYYLARYGSGYYSSSSSSSSNLGGSSVTIGSKSGWSNVRTSIRNAAAGATLNVSLGYETSIPEEILTALAGRNVTVNFTLSNGAVITYNGTNITTAKDVNVDVTYNTKNISSSLVSKAKSVNNAISSSQISVSSNTLGGSASLTVKFSTNRAGRTAKLYRYNSSRNSLQLVDTSTVASTGRVTFDKVTQGGDYVIVLI